MKITGTSFEPVDGRLSTWYVYGNTEAGKIDLDRAVFATYGNTQAGKSIWAELYSKPTPRQRLQLWPLLCLALFFMKPMMELVLMDGWMEC
jgi:hypothetical protein